MSAVSHTPRQRQPDAFDTMHALIQSRFATSLAATGKRLFTTDAAGLFDAYLGAFPAEGRQHHNCNCCRRFIERFGGLVVINDVGTTASALWSIDGMPGHYAASLGAMMKIVHGAKVTGVFVSGKADLGQHHEGGWTHFSAKLPADMLHRDSLKEPHEIAALKVQDFGTLSHALADFDPALVGKAMDVLNSDALYRGDRVSGPIKFLRDLHASLAGNAGKRRDNVIWKAVATAPAGFCTPRGAAAGALLTDLKSGMDFESVKRRFRALMAPSNYGRAQTAPTAGNLRVAENLVAKLGVERSLQRRYAAVEELPKLWGPRLTKPAPAPSGGVFGHITTRTTSAPAAASTLNIPPQVMTWDKFSRTVLPGATSIEIEVPSSTERFAALVTALHADAPPIIAWDTDENRNPFTWYYATGIDAEMKRRVEGAGGQYENVDIRATLLWNNTNDLDLMCYTPQGKQIYYGNKRDTTGGWLDVDMNVSNFTTKPVENIRWSKGHARAGRYRFMVWNFTDRNRDRAGTPFRFELEVGGRVFRVDGSVPLHRIQVQQPVVEFNLGADGQMIGEPRFDNQTIVLGVEGAKNQWGLGTGTFTPVLGIVQSPNQWGDKPMLHYGRHMFFLMDGCHDAAAGVGRGFFVETLKGEFHAARRTLEAFMASATIADAPGIPACGLGLSDQAPWNIVMRVKTEATVQLYKIDRWD